MSKPCLLFVVESPFTERDKKRFGIVELSSDFDVRIINVTPIVAPGIWQRFRHLQVVDECLYTALTHRSLVDLLQSIDFAAVISLLGIHEQRHAVYTTAQDRDALTLEMRLGTLPGDDLIFSNTSRRLTVRLQQLLNPLQSGTLLINKIQRRRFKQDSPRVLVHGGLASRRGLEGWAERFLPAHSLDYDLYVERRSLHPRASTEPIAVYLDQDIGYHADYEHLGLRSPVDPSSYYPELNHYLRHFERVTGLDVIIAPHPRADRSHLDERFPDFAHSNEPTINLVQRSSSVLAHVSTAISFAVLWKKPLFLLGGRRLMRSWYGPYISAFATKLNRPILDTSDPSPSSLPDDSFVVNRVAYAEYVREYLSSRTDDGRRLWDIVGEGILEELSERR